MDLEEWELLSDDVFLVDFHADDVVGGKNDSHHRRRRRSHSPNTPPKSVFNMNYFICPSPPSQKFISPTDDETPKVAQNQLVPVPIQLERPQFGGDIHILEKIKAPPPSSVVGTLLSGDQENQLPQVFFKKMKENEFVDMKMDSPKSNSRGGIMLQIDPGKFQFDDKKGDHAMEIMPISPKITRTEKEMVVINNNNNNNMDSDANKIEEEEEEVIINWEDNNNGGLNIWKWSLTGLGALCSIGVAAATICIIIFGNQHHQQNNQKLRFQIYSDDKRIKQVAHHHAIRLNDAISAIRGVPLNRAHITFGGYYDGL